jgi:hypothetical protein
LIAVLLSVLRQCDRAATSLSKSCRQDIPFLSALVIASLPPKNLGKWETRTNCATESIPHYTISIQLYRLSTFDFLHNHKQWALFSSFEWCHISICNYTELDWGVPPNACGPVVTHADLIMIIFFRGLTNQTLFQERP